MRATTSGARPRNGSAWRLSSRASSATSNSDRRVRCDPPPAALRPGAARRGRPAAGSAPAWRGEAVTPAGARLEFSRFASNEAVDAARRVGYRLNEKQEIELWLWPGLDVAPDTLPARYPVLSGVKTFELQYLNRALVWVDAWPTSPADLPIPRAVRLRIVLASDEEI